MDKRYLAPLLCLAVLAITVLISCDRSKPGDITPGPSIQSLTDAEKKAYYNLPEGSDLIPVRLFLLMEEAESKSLLLGSLPNYGVLFAEKNLQGDYPELPIGMTSNPVKLGSFEIDTLGFNCAFCHVGAIEVGGKLRRIDGAPNVVDVVKLVADSFRSLRLHANPLKGKFWRLVKRYLFGRSILPSVESSDDGLPTAEEFERDIKPEIEKDIEKIAACVDAAVTETWQGIQHCTATDDDLADVLQALGERYKNFRREWSLLRKRVKFAKHYSEVNEEVVETAPGFGRQDAWGVARNYVFRPKEYFPMTAPLSVPSIWTYPTGPKVPGPSDWHHWIGNTNSILQRNVAQVLAFGAVYEKDGTSTIEGQNLVRLEQLSRKLEPPKWSSFFGALDAKMVEEGERVFQSAGCGGCHDKRSIHPLKTVKTDPEAVDNFNRDFKGKPFYTAVAAGTSLVASKLPANEVAKPQWRKATGYTAPSLDGIWASGPYLHNGSVRTLWQLLNPDKRETLSANMSERPTPPRNSEGGVWSMADEFCRQEVPASRCRRDGCGRFARGND